MMLGPIINLRTISWILGAFTGALALLMLLPIAYALMWDSASQSGLEKAFLITVIIAVVLLCLGRKREKRFLREREAILLVVLIWLIVCVFGALPFYFSGNYTGITDAFFESASGFTTTGATILNNVESLRPALHLWRTFSHWIGGMGIVVLGLAVLPLLSPEAQGLYRAEFSGAEASRLRPRIQELARALWQIYLALTLLLFIALWGAGMSPFDSLCHAFSTMGTGGFSTRTASIGGFDNPLIEYIIIVFMLLAGISFIQHFRFWVKGQINKVLTDYEVRAYLVLLMIAALTITYLLHTHNNLDWEPAFRTALFQVVSILTTTGFVSADYAQWQPLAQMILLFLMFVGGCTGSTAGGLKVARIVLLWHVIKREFRRISEPHAIFRIRLGDEVISENTVNALLNLFYLALFILLVASLAVTATGVDVLTALSAVTACQFNVGPGLGGVGPAESFASLTDFAKWVLAFCMIAGRLEFYTLLVVLTRNFWKQ